jgi:glycosyltransferase involved in cell wall biosynthesis
VQAEHARGGAARNRGEREADPSQLIQFLDSDDVLPSDFFERAVAAFRAQPDTVAACADQRYVNEEGGVLRSRSLSDVAVNRSRWLAFNDSGIQSSTVLRRDVFLRCGPFREDLRYGEDKFVYYPVSREGPWAYLPGEAVDIRVLGDNLSTASPERVLTWMKEAEVLLRTLGLPPREVRWLLARNWARAGNSLCEAGRFDDARSCFRRAFRHRPFFAKAYRRLLRLAFLSRRSKFPRS